MAYAERRQRKKGVRYRGIYKAADGRYRPMGAENACHLGACAEEAAGSVAVGGGCARARPCDDFRLVGLKLIFLGIRIIRSAVQALRMNSITERWIGSCRRELLDRTLIWKQRHLMMVLREHEDFYNSHRPHRALDQAAPRRPLPDGVTDLDHFRVRRHDRVGGIIHEYRLVS